jgi:hypothetical protein
MSFCSCWATWKFLETSSEDFRDFMKQNQVPWATTDSSHPRNWFHRDLCMQTVPKSIAHSAMVLICSHYGLMQQYGSLPLEPSSPSQRSLQLGSSGCLSAWTSGKSIWVCQVHTVSTCSHFAVTGSGWNVCMGRKRSYREEIVSFVGGRRYNINIIFVYYDWGWGTQGWNRRLWEWLWSRIWATWNCHFVEVNPFSHSEITISEMSAAQTFIVQHSSRINSVGYLNFSWQYQTTNCLKTWNKLFSKHYKYTVCAKFWGYVR